MLRRYLVGLVGLVALGSGAGCAGRQAPEVNPDSPGAALYSGQLKRDVNCARCHGADATGGMRGPNLKKRLATLSDEQIAAAILEGPGMMPAFEGKLTEAEVGQIVVWLRGGDGGQAP